MACPRCNFESPPGAKVCEVCLHPLGKPYVDAAAAPEAAAPPKRPTKTGKISTARDSRPVTKPVTKTVAKTVTKRTMAPRPPSKKHLKEAELPGPSPAEFARFVSENVTQGQDSFVARFTAPFLISAALVFKENDSQPDGDDDGSWGPDSSATWIFAVRRKGDTGRKFVTIGRDHDNDIYIPSKLVSKRHAYFAKDKEGVWLIADAGSRNGTSVAGKDLAPHVPARLSGSEPVGLGPLRFHFFTPASLYSFMCLRQQVKK
jgi:hypothetical protein